MHTYKLVVEYDGTDFHGWQRQNAGGAPRARTIQGELEKALSTLCAHAVPVTGASRTDAGVHACGQVAHCELPRNFCAAELRAALNALLPRDIAVTRVVRAPRSFSARHHAAGKIYEYRVLQRAYPSALDRNAWWVRDTLDVGRMRRAARLFTGQKDFSWLGKKCASGESGVCRVRSVSVIKRGACIAIRCRGDRFLWNMVRNLARILVQAGRGAYTAAELARLIAARSNTLKNPAPARGLFLKKVLYKKVGKKR